MREQIGIWEIIVSLSLGENGDALKRLVCANDIDAAIAKVRDELHDPDPAGDHYVIESARFLGLVERS